MSDTSSVLDEHDALYEALSKHTNRSVVEEAFCTLFEELEDAESRIADLLKQIEEVTPREREI